MCEGDVAEGVVMLYFEVKFWSRRVFGDQSCYMDREHE